MVIFLVVVVIAAAALTYFYAMKSEQTQVPAAPSATPAGQPK